MRTFVDPARGTSPGHNPHAVYPDTGLFSNLAFSNFYSSTDESDIEAALQTARQYLERRSSLNPTSRRQVSDSEEEAPISGLNHLGEYLAHLKPVESGASGAE